MFLRISTHLVSVCICNSLIYYPLCVCSLSAVRHVEEDGVHKDAANRLVASLVNIRAIVNHFTPKIDSWSASHQVASLTPDQVGDCSIRVTWNSPCIYHNDQDTWSPTVQNVYTNTHIHTYTYTLRRWCILVFIQGLHFSLSFVWSNVCAAYHVSCYCYYCPVGIRGGEKQLWYIDFETARQLGSLWEVFWTTKRIDFLHSTGECNLIMHASLVPLACPQTDSLHSD